MKFEFSLKVPKKIKDEIAHKAKMDFVRLAVKEATATMQQKAQELVPVQTGFLKRSISQEIMDDGFTGHVYASAEYSASVEYGTRKRRPKPYMRPAFKVAKYQFIKRLREVKK